MNKFPRPGDEVMLSVPQRETVHATVAGMGDGFINLEMQASPRTPMQQLERSTLFVEFINDEGIARLSGRLESISGGPLSFGRGADDVVRFAHKHNVQLLQRREHIRAYVALKLECWRRGRESDPPMNARTVDISGGGLLVKGLSFARVGEEYSFALLHDEREMPMQGAFVVRHMSPGGEAGVQFTVLDERDRALITHLAFDLQREQKRAVS